VSTNVEGRGSTARFDSRFEVRLRGSRFDCEFRASTASFEVPVSTSRFEFDSDLDLAPGPSV